MINKKLDEISAKLETIKVLVQDNEYLSNVEKSCEKVNERNQILENRIQKAIEYIEKAPKEAKIWERAIEINEPTKEDLLDILRGSDKDIPGFEGTLEALDNLSIKGGNNE